MPQTSWPKFAGTLLVSHAAVWWRFRCDMMQQGMVDTWEEFTFDLRNSFGAVNTYEEAVDKLSKLEQRRDV